MAMREAEDQGNTDEADRLFPAPDIPAHTLMAIKHANAGGADWSRKQDFAGDYSYDQGIAG